jgi:hypothetical protein
MERKLVTVLFADLVGSTALADEEDPERTRAVLDRFYEEMAAEVETVDGTVEKFAGDAVMAAFGAPTAHEDHAERALHAALAMQRRLREAVDARLAKEAHLSLAMPSTSRRASSRRPSRTRSSSASARLPRRAARSNSASSERSRPRARNSPSSAAPC